MPPRSSRTDQTAGTDRGSAGDRILAAAREYGWDDLRPGQREAVEAALEGHDVLAVMPTGHGKSAIYQLAAKLLEGLTVVVSPLIALQRDQVEQLEEMGADPAVAVNSSQRVGENREAWEELEAGDAEFVFLAPEQLARDEVLERLRELQPSLLVVDEAHCVSAWGHDFRPEYLRLGHVVEALGHPTTVALTATAAPPVREEIVERLRMREPRQVVRGFDRPNIFLEVQRHSDDDAKRDAIVERAIAEAKPGLIYVATRKDAERYAAALAEAGVRAESYHAGMSRVERERVHDAFSDGSAEVVAATSAFGMGIDKADVRFVLHAAPPDSLDSYYQEIGRGGRDGEPALAALFHRQEDFGVHRFRTGGGADVDMLSAVAARVRRAKQPVPPERLRERLDVGASRLTSAVNLLEQAGAVETTDDGDLVWREGTVKPAVEEAARIAEARRRVDRSRVEMMRGYAETSGCRRRFLLGYFGEELPELCGACDTCRSGSAERIEEARESADASSDTAGDWTVGQRVRHESWGEGGVVSDDGDRITVLFDEEGYKTLALEVVERSGVLQQL
ncbi:RecQ family ATP-dependent DNA helicase [Agrococcus sp. Marseille-Q4369]|uniref:RecQ family ATP-dependent DNA helicase n=1 Tax=Agrococcus sp. Marseille-Q4369 TaxID=2810513 RepID=UPI001B8CB521|nr:RecQ family ATP-dependent DNA helicase [Agrococcus sp. Marseille-Q4369]QUW19629.1 RecQ family ATP-dependent DNA helicase [Agrococcus sp. Marseille-Q4369]